MGDALPLRVEQGEAIDWIVLDRPDAANAFSQELLQLFGDTLDRLEKEGAPVIGIRGEGRGFSAGADLGEYNAGATPMEDVARLRANLDRWLKLWRHPKPVILAIHGFCMGIAAQLPSFADIVIVADDARIGEPGIPLGGGYVAPTWVAHAGPRRAKEMAFLPGNHVDGRTAAEWGWANASVPADQLVPCATALAERIAKIPLPVLTMKKLSINRAMEAQGFLTAVNAISESDAILHLEPAVLDMRKRIREAGLKSVVAEFSGQSSTQIFRQFQGKENNG